MLKNLNFYFVAGGTLCAYLVGMFQLTPIDTANIGLFWYQMIFLAFYLLSNFLFSFVSYRWGFVKGKASR